MHESSSEAAARHSLEAKMAKEAFRKYREQHPNPHLEYVRQAPDRQEVCDPVIDSYFQYMEEQALNINNLDTWVGNLNADVLSGYATDRWANHRNAGLPRAPPTSALSTEHDNTRLLFQGGVAYEEADF